PPPPGPFADAIRHAITKISHLHFTSTESYRQRVIQLGENPATVYNVGAIGVDNIRRIPLWDKARTEESLGGFTVDRETLLVTYHPVTLENDTAESQITTLLDALDHTMTAHPGVRVIFTMPNSDTGSAVIAQKIEQWCAAPGRKARCVWFTSLGLKRYLSVLQYIGGVVGNSSSGILEVPSFHIPTLDIGDRQRGRIAAASVVHCAPDRGEIIEKLSLLLSNKIDASGPNPYESADTAQRIYRTLKERLTEGIPVQKHFYDQPATLK
ncbi:MAG: UDP-N-acetylglucosamine 2-epimerase, partial [Rikenellaceae bacterium]|nr:UDP-N-acetylglucosamine 2-epimerase [Rikenellaceae bacterium]